MKQILHPAALRIPGACFVSAFDIFSHAIETFDISSVRLELLISSKFVDAMLPAHVVPFNCTTLAVITDSAGQLVPIIEVAFKKDMWWSMNVQQLECMHLP